MLTRGCLSFILFINIFFSFSLTLAQGSQAMYYLNYSRSVHSIGMGDQAVALRSSEDALNYNPANLIFAERPTLSFFHQPFQMAATFFDTHFPLNSYSAIVKFDDIGAFGVEYIDWDWGEQKRYLVVGANVIEKTYHTYERSISFGYAREFCDNFAAGIQLRYAKSNFGYAFAEKLYVSAGLNYSPKIFDNKLNIGFSLTNLGTPVWYEDESQADPPPTKLNLGIGYFPFENEFFSLQTQLAISKIFDRGSEYNSVDTKAESSLEMLFTDWGDFPNDASLHTGIGFNWKPLDLGNGFAFFQEFYLGNYSVGVKSGLNNFYTHGGKIGIEFSGLQFSAGYAGRWHNVHSISYIPWAFPWETVQFSLGVNEDALFRKDEYSRENAKLKNIILSFGIGLSFRMGKYSANYSGEYNNLKEGFKDGNIFSIEGAFYLDEQSALVSSISYTPADYIIEYKVQQLQDLLKTRVEIFSLASSYRYHPFEAAKPLFFQGGFAIVRLNPIDQNLYPKYDYKTALILSVGGNTELFDNVLFCPLISYNLMLSSFGKSAPRLGGFNQLDLGLKLGYKF